MEKAQLKDKYPGTVDEYLEQIRNWMVTEDIEKNDWQRLKSYKSFAEYCPINRNKLINKEPHDVLVICNENQGRSQIASYMMQEIANILGLQAHFRSAGKHATPEKYDGKPSPTLIDFMQQIGTPIKDATVDQLRPSDITERTMVVDLSNNPELPENADLTPLIISFGVNDVSAVEPQEIKKRIPSTYDELFYFVLRFMFKLAEATEKSDYRIIVEEFPNVQNSHHIPTLSYVPEKLRDLSQFRQSA